MEISTCFVAPSSGARIGFRPSATNPAGGYGLLPEPGSTRGRNVWPDATPSPEVLDGSGGRVLRDQDLKRLGGPAVALWGELLRRRGHANQTLTIHLSDMARKLGLSSDQVTRGMRRLADVWLLDRNTSRTYHGPAWRSVLHLRVWGTVTPGGCWWAPTEAEGRIRSLAGRGGRRLGAGRPPRSRIQTAVGHDEGPSTTTSFQAVTDRQDIQTAALYVRESREPCSSFLTGKKSPQPANLFTGLEPTRMMQIDKPPSRSTLQPKLTGDPDHPVEKERRLTRLGWLMMLVDAYNAAYRAIGHKTYMTMPGSRKAEVEFGTWEKGRGFQRADHPYLSDGKNGDPPVLEGWDNYPKLMACARVLHDKDIPPSVWALWAVKRNPKKVLPIKSIFSAGQVSDNGIRAIFRNESGYGHGDGSRVSAPTREHFEQMYRLREAARIRDRRGGGLFGLPVWYAEIRQKEIDAGYADPLALFTTIIPKDKP